MIHIDHHRDRLSRRCDGGLCLYALEVRAFRRPLPGALFRTSACARGGTKNQSPVFGVENRVISRLRGGNCAETHHERQSLRPCQDGDMTGAAALAQRNTCNRITLQFEEPGRCKILCQDDAWDIRHLIGLRETHYCAKDPVA